MNRDEKPGAARQEDAMVHLRLASVLPTPRALKKSICLAVPALLFFADRADAACYMRPNLSQLPRPHVVVDDATHTVYSTGQKANVLSTGFSFFPTACGLAIGWPVYRAIQITGEWNKVTKTATENVKVKVSTPIFPNSGAATYAGIISQKCKQDRGVSTKRAASHGRQPRGSAS
jgi:hypothetical protein